jgi:hypothetical protein
VVQLSIFAECGVKAVAAPTKVCTKFKQRLMSSLAAVSAVVVLQLERTLLQHFPRSDGL